MSGAAAGAPLEVAVEPHNDYYDPADDRWRDQVATLVADLDAQADTVRRGRPVEGTKGAADQLIIALAALGRSRLRWTACVPGWGATGTGASTSDGRRTASNAPSR